MTVLKSKRILLGVTGSIACYKAADLASKLAQQGAEVNVILTSAATRFIAPLTFQSLTGCRAYTDNNLWGAEGHVLHVNLGRQADLIAIAPATANTLAKLAHGQADNLLTLAALASKAPLLLAPAMDGGMYEHPATQVNLDILKARGATIVGPQRGHLASGLNALGRMTEPGELLGYIRQLLGRSGPLAGREVVVTAGGTQEAVDPVRAITNRSSGKQGYALAQAAVDLGAQVTLISAPTALAAPVGCKLVSVISAEEMGAAVLSKVKGADVLLMAAAVADFRPSRSSKQKIKRAAGVPDIRLVANPDILLELSKIKGKKPQVIVGFAAESKDLIKNAQEKLGAKKLDLIVANDISAEDAGFEVDTNRVLLLDKKGNQQQLPLMSKEEVARVILERVVDLLGE
ncbi:MAG: bifunctional phosphopantothenoylcysteine decarboxylase/phosphopantothenate--cysteine ligase CoaBC [Chloroflexi bacterium]|nr:bifunctional phosphopantothenoylcysteine decarboxylase/phosphopantothenate--cysteine ligase CoaBC [Chloroflexota bacterium]